MKNVLGFLKRTKRQKFVLSVFILSSLLFISEFFIKDIRGLIIGVGLAFLTSSLLWLILRKDVLGTFYYPILILPFFYTLSFNLFYTLIPSSIISKLIITSIYAVGLYSLYLSHNIFAVSAIRTINLLRSARVVSFIITILVVLFFINIIFTLHFAIPTTLALIFVFAFLLNMQSFWSYSLDKTIFKEIIIYSSFNALALTQLAGILTIWPVNATLYAIFLSSMFYIYSGLSHAWFEKRLFKGILWEYVWVCLLAIGLLFIFARWGI